MDLLLKESGDEQPEGLHACLHKGFEGDYPVRRMLPSVFYQMKGELAMVVQGEKQLVLKIMWEALKKLIRRIFHKPI